MRILPRGELKRGCLFLHLDERQNAGVSLQLTFVVKMATNLKNEMVKNAHSLYCRGVKYWDGDIPMDYIDKTLFIIIIIHRDSWQ